MNDLLFEIPARTLARKFGINYSRLHLDIYNGIVPARRFGALWMIPINNERVQELFKDRETYYRERKKYVKNKKRRVMYKGEVYETQAELARKMGVSRSTVQYWMQTGKAKRVDTSNEMANNQ